MQWSGVALETTYVSATQVTAVVPADLLAQVGTASITIVNPAPGGGASEAVTFTVTETPTKEIDTSTQEWNNYLGFYQLLCYQYFATMGLDPLSSFTWGSIFAQYNANLGAAKGSSPLVSLMLFNYFLSQGGDPYSSGILATSLTGKGGTFTPASGSPSERVASYYQNLGIAADGLSDLYSLALGLGHPDDAIAALIAAQHGAWLV